MNRPNTRLARRHRAEARFRLAGRMACLTALAILLLLLGKLFAEGLPAFRQAVIRLPVALDDPALDLSRPEALPARKLVFDALAGQLPEPPTSFSERRALSQLLSMLAETELKAAISAQKGSIKNPLTVTFTASDTVDQWLKGHLDTDLPHARRALSDTQIAWLTALRDKGALELVFNMRFLTAGDSREPELAGILGGLLGSAFLLLACMAVAIPLGIMTAVYLEEFARRGRLFDFIEININNLAAVPSIVFGLLGLALYLNLFGMPRSSALVGGLTIALLILPTIIIATRAALRAVPPSIREAARGLGASPLQVVMHHVLPLALPGILTGIILGMARAIGETAPLLMIGMVAFIADVPGGLTDPATALPVQIYLWAESPERAFAEKTSAAILILLVVLLGFNALAVWLRRRFERKW